MMGETSDNEDAQEEDKDSDQSSGPGRPSSQDSGCSWGMGESQGGQENGVAAPRNICLFPAAEEVVPEEDDNEENPFSTEFLEDQEAAYLKDPKKALQGFYDREGEMNVVFFHASIVCVI